MQKKQAAQARNLEKKGKSEEERKAAREKSAYVLMRLVAVLTSQV